MLIYLTDVSCFIIIFVLYIYVKDVNKSMLAHFFCFCRILKGVDPIIYRDGWIRPQP